MLVEVLISDLAEIISSSGFSSFSDLEDSLLELDIVLISLIFFEVSLVLERDSDRGFCSSLTRAISETFLGVDSDDLDLLEVRDELLDFDFKDTGFNSTLSTVDDLLDEVLDTDFGSDFFEVLVEVLDSDFVGTISTFGSSESPDEIDVRLVVSELVDSISDFSDHVSVPSDNSFSRFRNLISRMILLTILVFGFLPSEYSSSSLFVLDLDFELVISSSSEVLLELVPDSV